MSRLHSYISSASNIIDTYQPGQPLAMHIKNFFAAEKKYGSRDRKSISSLCYNYFRLGHALKAQSTEERMLAGLFLCEDKTNDMLRLMRPDWNEQLSLAVKEKLSILNIAMEDIFPFAEQISGEINKDAFILSLLKQPAPFLRIRPGRKDIVIQKLNNADVSFGIINENCLKLQNNTSLDKILKINKDVVVQDLNSQAVFSYLQKESIFTRSRDKIHAWDCCAASGGKSILLYDNLNGKIQLTVSDIRENILVNLKKRLRQAGINIHKSFVADLSKDGMQEEDKFSLIILDAPCTGSGTWSRTPEQLFSFTDSVFGSYTTRQKQIADHVVPHLKKDGLFFYITCSVFKKENEDVVRLIENNKYLSLLHMEYLPGYQDAADTMFVAVFGR